MYRTIRYYSVFFMFVMIHLHAIEFVYPISVIPESDLIYLMYQKSPHHLELWQWNYKTQQADPALLTRFTPAGIALLPNNKGFSFIDNGTIKVKGTYKRSPKTLELDEPLYDIRSVAWLDEEKAFICAKRATNYGIFFINLEGEVATLLYTPDQDSMYPQIINDQLFYVSRNVKTDAFSIRYRLELNNQLTDEELVCFGFQPIAFLHMINENHGYVIGHPRYLERHHKIINFICYEIKRSSEMSWNKKALFSFDIPTGFLFFDTSMRLYESMLPLLPRYTQNSIYYSNYIPDTNGAFLRPYCYSLKNKASVLCSFTYGDQHYFSPCAIDSRVYFGGSIDDLDNANSLFVDPIDLGLVRVVIPYISM